MGNRISEYPVKTIIFVFAGRKENLSLQLPCIKRVLESNPETEYHIWDLSQNESDHQWLQKISGERITVYDDFYGDLPWKWFNEIYRFYTHKWFSGFRFVKMDEDVIFVQDRNFGSMVAAIDANPGAFITARVVNNAACTVPELAGQFTLRDAHLSVDYAMTCHQYMFDNWREMSSSPICLMNADNWLSINMIGYSYDMGCQIASLVGQQVPSGAYANVGNVPREITPTGTLGDEGVVNLFPRLILQGFLACHLYFGPQRKLMSDTDITYLRKHYAEIGRLYSE